MNRFLRLVLGLIAIGGVVFGGTAIVSARGGLTEEEMNMYSQNNINFYEPCNTSGGGESSECGITVTGSTIEEKIWSGLTSFMSEEQAAGVMGNMAHEGGFSPARHETSFLNSSPNFAIMTNTSDSYGIGLIQWSFGRRVKVLNFIKEKASALLDKYIDGGRKEYGGLQGSDFLSKAGDSDTNTLIALELCYLKQELEDNSTYGGILEETTVEGAADYFLEKVEVPGNIEGTRPVRRRDAQKFYDQFHGKTISGPSGMSGDSSDPACNSCAQGSLNINGTAVCLAWPLGTESSVYKYAQANGLTSTSAYGNISKWTGGKATDAFNAAIDAVYPDRKWSQCPRIGASCDVGVGTTIRYSGYDKEWPRGLGEQLSHAQKHPELWEILKGNGLEPMAGDVVNYSHGKGGHTYIVVQDEKGDFYRAESGLCSNFWRISGKFKGFESNATVFRAKNAKNSSNGVSVTDGVKSSSTTGILTSTSSNGTVTSGNMDIGATARYFAWPEGTSSRDWKTHAYRAEEWEKFREQSGKNKISINGNLNPSEHIWMGRSCVIFVWGVLKYAGLTNTFGGTEKLESELEKQDDWELVGSGSVKVSDIQDGDVFVWRQKNSNGNPGHYGILIRDDDGVRTIEASLHAPSYGKITSKKYSDSDTFNGGVSGGVNVWRNKKNKSGGSSCDLCDGEGDDGGGQLKAGGFTTVEEADAFIKSYRDAAMGKYYKKSGSIKFGIKNGKIYDAGCPYGVMNNCVALSQWFINNYTTVGPNWNNTTNGVGLVDSLAKTAKLKTGKEPRPYAIFSNSEWSDAGHTGVILGVDTEKKTAIIGEATCSEGAGRLYYEPRAKLYKFSQMSGWTYAYTDDVISMGGPLQDV